MCFAANLLHIIENAAILISGNYGEIPQTICHKCLDAEGIFVSIKQSNTYTPTSVDSAKLRERAMEIASKLIGSSEDMKNALLDIKRESDLQKSSDGLPEQFGPVLLLIELVKNLEFTQDEENAFLICQAVDIFVKASPFNISKMGDAIFFLIDAIKTHPNNHRIIEKAVSALSRMVFFPRVKLPVNFLPRIFQYDAGRALFIQSSTLPAARKCFDILKKWADAKTFTTHAELDSFIAGLSTDAIEFIKLQHSELECKWQAFHYFFIRTFSKETVMDDNYVKNFPGPRCHDYEGRSGRNEIPQRFCVLAVSQQTQDIKSAVLLRSSEIELIKRDTFPGNEWEKMIQDMFHLKYEFTDTAKRSLARIFYLSGNILYRRKEPLPDGKASSFAGFHIYIVPCGSRLRIVDAIQSRAFLGQNQLKPIDHYIPKQIPQPKILTIDGGGFRGGLIALEYLIALESRLKLRNEKKMLIEYFDFVAGTSIGGIILLILLYGSSEMKGSLKIVKEFLLRLGPLIFDNDTGIFWMVAGGKSGRFLSENLEKELRRHLAGDLMATKCSPLCFVTTKRNQDDFFFCNYPSDDPYHSNQVSAWIAARATSAAPSYFRPLEFWESKFSDGGVGMNNPSFECWLQAKKMLGAVNPKTFISIGCGQYVGENLEQRFFFSYLGTGGKVLDDAMELAQKAATDVSQVHRHLQQLFSNPQDKKAYHRLDVKLDRVIDLSDVSAVTTSYIHSLMELEMKHRSEELDQIVEQLTKD